LADADRPVPRLALLGAPRGAVRVLEQLARDIVLGEVVDGEMLRLVQEPGAPAVDDRLAGDEGANPLRDRVPVEHRVRSVDLDVEAASGTAAERTAPGRQGYRSRVPVTRRGEA